MTSNTSIGVRSARAALLAAVALLAACERPPMDSVQRGYRGTGMDQIYNPRTIARQQPLNVVPADTPLPPPGGPPARAVFKNVQVVGDLSVAEFSRLMVSITAWVSPDQGCAYCHRPGEDLSSDSLYTKVVARRMLQMNRRINTDWKSHVADAGVTCYTCHRGYNVPPQAWVAPPADRHQFSMLGNNGGQNQPAPTVGLASLPYDPFTPYLDKTNEARVIGGTALPTGNRNSIKQTEFTYALMMHMSQSLGVNCTYCHNSRSFAEWDTSTPQRSTAWYGIRMARDLNSNYIDSVARLLPAERLGPTGDVPKVSCATCHQGAYKPLYGAKVIENHPALIGPQTTSVAPADGAASAPAPVQAAVGNAALYFSVGSPALTADAVKELTPLVAALNAQAGSRLVLSGFHSAAGDLVQNQELAKQRAFAVRDALLAAGVPADRIALDKPQQTEANIAGEDQKARRVEVAVRQ